MEHPIEPVHVGTLEELGTHIAQMRYDAMLVVFHAFKQELLRQQCADGKKQRYMLSHHGVSACRAADDLMRALGKMWDISVPYMEHDLSVRPPLVNMKHVPRKVR